MARKRHIDRKEHHQASDNLGKAVHKAPRFLVKENKNGTNRTDESTSNRGNPKKNIHTETGTANIADVEGKSAGNDKGRNEVAKTRQDCVGNILTWFFGNGDDAPHIELGNRMDDDSDEDDKAKAPFELVKLCCLREKNPGPQ